MGAESKIAWTHHTFNPWMGCAKVSEACKHVESFNGEEQCGDCDATPCLGHPVWLGDRSHGADPREWPADLRVQEFPR